MQWLQRHDKSLPIPSVVYAPIEWCGGFYVPPDETAEVEIEGHFYDAKGHGIIAVSTEWPDLIESTLAHEWRHHWQRFNKLRSFPAWPWKDPADPREYDDAIIRYFGIWHEWDALMFEHRYATNYWTDHRIGLLANSGRYIGN